MSNAEQSLGQFIEVAQRIDNIDELVQIVEELNEIDYEKLAELKSYTAFDDIYRTFVYVSSSFEATVRSSKYIDYDSEEFNEWYYGNLAGRCSSALSRDLDYADKEYFAETVGFIAEEKFEDRIEDFDPDKIAPQDWGNLVDQVGKKLHERFSKEDIGIGSPARDLKVIDYIQAINSLTTLALASGSRLTYAKARKWLEDFDRKFTGYHIPAPKSADDLDINLIMKKAMKAAKQAKINPLKMLEDIEKYIEDAEIIFLVADILGGDKSTQDLIKFKESYGENWQQYLERHIVKASTGNCLLKLEQTEPSQHARLARQVADMIKDRMKLHQKLIFAEKLADELEGNEDLTDSTDVLELKSEAIAELDWTVLPEGEEELRAEAEDIVKKVQERSRKEVSIDLERLNILRHVREYWGKDRCYYARGRLAGRSTVRVNGQEKPDEYIVLVMQELDGNGNVAAEHAIAESPITERNALYVFRSDVSEGLSWREVYALPKKDARALKARRVKHTRSNGKSLVDEMTEKVVCLMFAEREEFLAIRFSGDRIRMSKTAGRIAIEAASSNDKPIQ